MRGWLLLLSAYLLVWVPVSFAALASRSLPSIDHRGPAALVELVVHAMAAMLCTAAGWMLWARNPAGAHASAWIVYLVRSRRLN